MDRLDSTESDLDLDIDLESGETSEEDAIRVNEEDIGLMSDSSGSIDGRNWLGSFENISSTEGNSAKETNLRREMVNIASNKTMDKGDPKKQKSTRPPKPPRPPNGPTLNPSDMKLLKEISELNLQRKKMERIRTLRKIKKEKASTPSSNIFALLVTVIFFLVIIFQGLLGSRM